MSNEELIQFMSVEEIQQAKTLFAERYLRRPNDALMIVANILGKRIDGKPLIAISCADAWPNDEFVQSEIKRLQELPPNKRTYIIQVHEWAKQCMERGEEKAAIDAMRLIFEAEGIIKAKGVSDNGKSDDKLKELAAMVVDGIEE